MQADAAPPHLPRQVPIESYGKGGFSFARMSHRGSLLCLPSGIWAWPVTRPDEITEATLAAVFAAGDEIGLFLVGTGAAAWALPQVLRERFAARKIVVEVSLTATAMSTYNLLLGESRRVGAGLIAVA